jgi:hypothetical protein
MKITESQFKEILVEEIKEMLEAQEIDEGMLDEIGWGLGQLGKTMRGPGVDVLRARGVGKTATQQSSKILQIHFARLIKGFESFVADAKKLGHDENSEVIGKQIKDAMHVRDDLKLALKNWDAAAITAAGEDRPEHTRLPAAAPGEAVKQGDTYEYTSARGKKSVVKVLDPESGQRDRTLVQQLNPETCKPVRQIGVQTKALTTPSDTCATTGARAMSAEQQSREIA